MCGGSLVSLLCMLELFCAISTHLPRGSDPSGRVHGEAAYVIGVVEVEPLPVILGVVAHASPARVVHHLYVTNRC